MKASSANLLSLIKGPKQFVIPIYQRTYSWHINQCDQLLKDIIRVSKDDSIQGHFIGSVVYFQESIHTVSDVPKLLVIDGQQRLTTVTLLVAALADFIKNNDIEIETNPTKLRNYYLFNAEEEDELHYKLALTRGDKDTLKNILKGIKPEDMASLRLIENYDFFKSNINLNNAVDIYNGLLRLFIVDVALEKDKDNPQLIFESLNSTGLALSQADLIRNYVLMGQESKLQKDLYEKYWYPMEQSYGNEYGSRFDSYIRDYLTMKTGKIPKIGHVYEAFKIYVQEGKAPENITDLVADIFKYSSYYVKMVLHKEEDLKLNEKFKQISKLRVDVSYPFLMAVYNDYVAEHLSSSEFLQILKLIENYVFRRAICGIPTNSMNKTFANLYKSVRVEEYLESIKAAFQMMESYKRFPADTEFEKEIVTKDLYNFRNRNYLLDNLENHNRKERLNVEEYTIEHIMPQNIHLSTEWQNELGENWKKVHLEYLHTLGNLTLTRYNPELSNRCFAEKKTMDGGFNDSPIRLNSYLREIDKWNAAHIQLRAKQLTDKAKQIWFAPELTEAQLEKFKPQKSNEEYNLESYEYLKDDILALYEALAKRILNIDSSIRVECKKLYITFKSSTNFVDIVPQKSRLRLSLNMGFEEVLDPKNLCKDVSGVGRWGNGDVELGFSNLSDIDNVTDLIQQAFDKQENA